MADPPGGAVTNSDDSKTSTHGTITATHTNNSKQAANNDDMTPTDGSLTALHTDNSKQRPEVLGIVELLENILVYLPIRDLVACERVCRKWKAVLSGSLCLQRSTFILPSKHYTVNPPKKLSGLLPFGRSESFCGIEKIYFWECCASTEARSLSLSIDLQDGSVRQVDKIAVRINPLVSLTKVPHHSDMPSVLPIGMVFRVPHDSRGNCEFRESGEIDVLFEAVGSNWWEQGWNKMLLTDPPCTAIRITQARHRLWKPEGSKIREIRKDVFTLPRRIIYFRFTNDQGITLGNVRTAALGYLHALKRSGRPTIHSHFDPRDVDLDTVEGREYALRMCPMALRFYAWPKDKPALPRE